MTTTTQANIVYSLEQFKGKTIDAGNRLSRIIYKKSKDAETTPESKGVIIPALTVSIINAFTANETGREYLIDCLQELQDKVIRRVVEAGHKSIFNDQIGIDAMLSLAAETNETVRFSSKSIAVWFDGEMAIALTDALQSKGLPKTVAEKHILRFKADFMSLSGRDVVLSVKTKNQLVKAMALLQDIENEFSVVRERVAEKLNSIVAVNTEDVL